MRVRSKFSEAWMLWILRALLQKKNMVAMSTLDIKMNFLWERDHNKLVESWGFTSLLRSIWEIYHKPLVATWLPSLPWTVYNFWISQRCCKAELCICFMVGLSLLTIFRSLRKEVEPLQCLWCLLLDKIKQHFKIHVQGWPQTSQRPLYSSLIPVRHRLDPLEQFLPRQVVGWLSVNGLSYWFKISGMGSALASVLFWHNPPSPSPCWSLWPSLPGQITSESWISSLRIPAL